ncbi:MAG: hypothetical protein L0Z50_36835 [Verrucomicrobiales bacterium]|nr:hypothetical protein [Verrucomicrobiales bacterium]
MSLVAAIANTTSDAILIADTLLERENHFRAVSRETQIIRGRRRHEEQVYPTI